MKRILPILALAAVSSFAGGLKYGVDAAGLLTMPSLDGSGAPDTKLGFGGKIAGAVEYGASEQLAVRGTVGYALTTWGYESKVDMGAFGSISNETTCTSHFVALGADAVYAVAPSIQLIGGLGVDIPVSGSYENKSSTTFSGATKSTTIKGDVKDTKVGVSLEAGAGYAINPALSLNAKYRFALTEYAKNIRHFREVCG